MSQVKERILRLIEELPDEWLADLAEHLEDALALAQAKRDDDGTRVAWRDLQKGSLDENTT